jgi:hypothetical protein
VFAIVNVFTATARERDARSMICRAPEPQTIDGKKAAKTCILAMLLFRIA